jgi:hypothetical protein
VPCAAPSSRGWRSQNEAVSGDRARHLTLVLPGLLGPLPGDGADARETARFVTEGLSLPALERFLSRSTPSPHPALQPGLAALLFDCFGVVKEGPDWPVAAVTRLVDGAIEDGRWWLRADPVHLRAGMGDLSLMDSAALHISMAEARALSEEINAQLEAPGLRLQALSQQRWYLSLDQAPRLATRAPWEVSGSPIGDHLPRGDDEGPWRARINDIQMILHASPVNGEREGRGQPAINSLWLWGGGRTPPVAAGAWQAIWSDDPLVAGLAGLARVTSHGLPEDAGAWLARAPAPGQHLLVSSAAYVPMRCSDFDAWRSTVCAIENGWMAPLLGALASGHVQSVSLRSLTGNDFRLRRGQAGHWWRRSKPLARFLTDSR